MIDATAIAAEIDAIDYSAVSIRPEFIDANGHLNVGYTPCCSTTRSTCRGHASVSIPA